MSGVCPLCNDTKEITVLCPCGEKMRDSGLVSDYYGPYSPYFNVDFEDSFCRHLFTCPQCGKDKVIKIRLE